MQSHCEQYFKIHVSSDRFSGSAFFLKPQHEMIYTILLGKDTTVTKTSDAPSTITSTTEEEKSNVKFAAGTTFNREKTGESP